MSELKPEDRGVALQTGDEEISPTRVAAPVMRRPDGAQPVHPSKTPGVDRPKSRQDLPCE